MLTDDIFNAAWESLKPAKIPTLETGFMNNANVYRIFMESDLRKSGLNGLHINGQTPPMLSLPKGAHAGYIIPYLTPEGEYVTDAQGLLAMYRIRLQRPEHSKESRYTQPTSEQLAKSDLPSYFPYIHPLTLRLPGERIICAEGEKKTVSILRHLGIPAFGIGGCQMWRNPDGSGSIHPWIQRLLKARGIKEILIVPDGDLLRYDICNAYGTLAHTLSQEGYDVKICNPDGKIDDLLVEWADNAQDRFAAVPLIAIEELVQSKSYLAGRYNLSFSKNERGVVSVPQTTSNVQILLENHPAFPRIWRNADDNRVYIGVDQAKPDLSEMQIANYFQHNLGFDKVNHRMVFSVVQALAKQNQKSPFLDWVKGLQWDGKQRLETWMIQHWGVENTPFVREVSKKWLISSCARMERPGTKVDWMLIVVGPQGVGKTSMPSVVFKQNSLTLYGESNDKDLHMKLHSALVIGFDELDSFGKKESSFLKAMISTAQDHFRPPYGASVEVFDRRCTLYGCGNMQEFLHRDPSGYRRYPVVRVEKKLDFAGLEKETPQLWAEAWNLYTMGAVNFWEVELADAEARKYVAPSLLQDVISDYVEKAKQNASNVKDGAVYLRYGPMMESLNLRSANPREVAGILREMGADLKKSRGPLNGGAPTSWWVIPIL